MEDRAILAWHQSAAKFLAKFLWLLLFMVSICSCAGPREFGPYSGKVVDAETNEPIEGAVIHIEYDTELYIIALAGPVSKFADAVEVVTDENGEFNIPRHRISLFRIFHRWTPNEHAIIFKPGYGVYPRHEGSYAERNAKTIGHENLIIKLPKLNTKKERELNISNAYYTSAPREKQKQLIKAITIEYTNLGFKPPDSNGRK